MPRIVRRRKMYNRRRKLAGKRKAMYRTKRAMSAMTDRAKVVEVENFEGIAANVGQNLTWQLSLYPRALAVSKNFRYYRCTRVELNFIPYANVFSPGQSLPELYYQTDYTTALATPAPTQALMESRGVVPVKWTGIIKRSFSPAVLRYENLEVQKTADVLDVQPVTSTPVRNRWYMTQQVYTATAPFTTAQVGPALDPTNLKYHGAAFFPNSPATPGNVGRLVIKTHWEFKEPVGVVSSS